MESNLDKGGRKAMRCRHCGGTMRDYRDGVSCLLCGRTLEHRCDSCKLEEEKTCLKKEAA